MELINGKYRRCSCCKVDLDSNNYFMSLAQCATYKCKECYTTYNKPIRKKWGKDNPDKVLAAGTRRHHKIPAGVYCIKEGETIIYIGESKRPIGRKYTHFNKQGKATAKLSKVNLYIQSKGKENFSWEMMHFEDDKEKRLQKEAELIQQYNPEWN